MIRVIILDDHQWMRDGIRAQLIGQDDIAVVGEGGSGEELEQLLHDQHPDVLLLDLNMPQPQGGNVRAGPAFRPLAALEWLRNTYPQTRVLIVSQNIDRALLAGTARAGIAGYIVKDDVDEGNLAAIVRTLHGGGFYFSPSVTAALRETPATGVLDLTPRQVDILRTIVTNPNRTLAEHARELGISTSTLNSHLRTIYEQLGVNNLTAAALMALRGGLA